MITNRTYSYETRNPKTQSIIPTKYNLRWHRNTHNSIRKVHAFASSHQGTTQRSRHKRAQNLAIPMAMAIANSTRRRHRHLLERTTIVNATGFSTATRIETLRRTDHCHELPQNQTSQDRDRKILRGKAILKRNPPKASFAKALRSRNQR